MGQVLIKGAGERVLVSAFDVVVQVEVAAQVTWTAVIFQLSVGLAVLPVVGGGVSHGNPALGVDLAHQQFLQSFEQPVSPYPYFSCFTHSRLLSA